MQIIIPSNAGEIQDVFSIESNNNYLGFASFLIFALRN